MAAFLHSDGYVHSYPGTDSMNLAKEVLLAVLAATWIVGLVHQFGSWPMTVGYVAISVVMAGVMFGGDLRVLKYARRATGSADRSARERADLAIGIAIADFAVEERALR